MICSIDKVEKGLNVVYNRFSGLTPFRNVNVSNLIQQAFSDSALLEMLTPESNPNILYLMDYVALKDSVNNPERTRNEIANALLDVVKASIKQLDIDFRDIDVVLTNIRYIPVRKDEIESILKTKKITYNFSIYSLPLVAHTAIDILYHYMLSSFIGNSNLYVARYVSYEAGDEFKHSIYLPDSLFNSSSQNTITNVFVPIYDIVDGKVVKGLLEISSDNFKYDSKTSQLLIKDISVLSRYTGNDKVLAYKIEKTDKGYGIVILPKTAYKKDGTLVASDYEKMDVDELGVVENNFYYLKNSKVVDLYSRINVDKNKTPDAKLYVFSALSDVKRQSETLIAMNRNLVLLSPYSERKAEITLDSKAVLSLGKNIVTQYSEPQKNLLLFSIVQMMVLSHIRKGIDANNKEALKEIDSILKDVKENFIDAIEKIETSGSLVRILNENRKIFNRLLNVGKYINGKPMSFMDMLVHFKINIFKKDGIYSVLSRFVEDAIKDDSIRLSIKSFLVEYRDSFKNMYESILTEDSEDEEELNIETAQENGEPVDLGGEGFDRTTVENLLDDKFFMMIASAISEKPQDVLSRFITVVAAIKKANHIKDEEIYDTLYRWFVLNENEENLDWVGFMEKDSELLPVFRMILLHPNTTDDGENKEISSLVHYMSYLKSQFNGITPVSVFGYNKKWLHNNNRAYVSRIYTQKGKQLAVSLGSRMMFLLSLMKQYRNEKNKQKRDILKKAAMQYYIVLMNDVNALVGKGINFLAKDSDILQYGIDFIVNEEAIYSTLLSFSQPVSHYYGVAINASFYNTAHKEGEQGRLRFIVHSNVNPVLPSGLKDLSYIEPSQVQHFDIADETKDGVYRLKKTGTKYIETSIHSERHNNKVINAIESKLLDEETVSKYFRLIRLSREEKAQVFENFKNAIRETLRTTGVVVFTKRTENKVIVKDVNDVRDPSMEDVVISKYEVEGAIQKLGSHVFTHALELYKNSRNNRAICDVGSKQPTTLGANKPGLIARDINEGKLSHVYNCGVVSAMVQNPNTFVKVAIIGPFDGDTPETDTQNKIIGTSVLFNTGITSFANSPAGANRHYTIHFGSRFNTHDVIPYFNPVYHPLLGGNAMNGLLSAHMSSFIKYSGAVGATSLYITEKGKNYANKMETYAGNISSSLISIAPQFVSDEMLAKHIEGDPKAKASIGRLSMRATSLMKLKQELYYYIAIRMFDRVMNAIEREAIAKENADFKVHSGLIDGRKMIKDLKEKNLKEIFKSTYGIFTKQEFEQLLPVADNIADVLLESMVVSGDITSLEEYFNMVVTKLKSNNEQHIRDINKELYTLFSDAQFERYSFTYDMLFDSVFIEGASIDGKEDIKRRLAMHYNTLMAAIGDLKDKAISFKDGRSIGIIELMNNIIGMMYGRDVFSMQYADNTYTIRIKKGNRYVEHKLDMAVFKDYDKGVDTTTLIEAYRQLREFQIVFNYHYRIVSSYLDAVSYLKPTSIKETTDVDLKVDGNRLTPNPSSVYFIPIYRPERGTYELVQSTTNDVDSVIQQIQDTITPLAYHVTSSTVRRNREWLKENVLTREDVAGRSFSDVVAEYNYDKDGKALNKMTWGDLFFFDRLVREDSVYETYNSLFLNNASLWGKKARMLYGNNTMLFGRMNIDERNISYFRTFISEKMQYIETTGLINKAFNQAGLYRNIGVEQKTRSNNRSQTDVEFTLNGFQEAILHHYVLNKKRYEGKESYPAFFDSDFSDSNLNGFIYGFDIPFIASKGKEVPFLAITSTGNKRPRVDYTKVMFFAYFFDNMLSTDIYNFINDRISVKTKDGSKRDKQSDGLSVDIHVVERLQKDIPEALRVYNGELKVMTFDDFMIDLSLTNKITEAYSKTIKELGEIEYFNGWGVIPLELFRVIAIATKEWSDKKEEAYWNIINGKEADIDVLIDFGSSRESLIGGLKPHNAAILLNTMVTGHNQEKYALFPIHPNMFKNSATKSEYELLSKMYEVLKANRAHMLVFESGSKQHKVRNVNSQKNKIVVDRGYGHLDIADNWLMPKEEYNDNIHKTNISFLKIVTPQSKKVKDKTYLNVKFLVFSWLLKHSEAQASNKMETIKVGDREFHNLRYFMKEELKQKGIEGEKADKIIDDTFEMARKMGSVLIQNESMKRNNISEMIEATIGISDLNTYATISDVIDKMIDVIFEGNKGLKEQVAALIESGINGFSVGDMTKVYSLLKKLEETRTIYGNLNVVIPHYQDIPNVHNKTYLDSDAFVELVMGNRILSTRLRFSPYVYLNETQVKRYKKGNHVYVDGIMYTIDDIVSITDKDIRKEYKEWYDKLNNREKAIHALSLHYNLDKDLIQQVIDAKDNETIIPEGKAYRVVLGRGHRDAGLLSHELYHADILFKDGKIKENIARLAKDGFIRIAIHNIPIPVYAGIVEGDIVIFGDDSLSNDYKEVLRGYFSGFRLHYLDSYTLSAVSLHGVDEGLKAQLSWVLPSNYQYADKSLFSLGNKGKFNSFSSEELEKQGLSKYKYNILTDYYIDVEKQYRSRVLEHGDVVFINNQDVSNNYYSYVISKKLSDAESVAFGIREKDSRKRKQKFFYVVSGLMDVVDYVSSNPDDVTLEHIKDSIAFLLNRVGVDVKDEVLIEKIATVLNELRLEIDDINNMISAILDILFDDSFKKEDIEKTKRLLKKLESDAILDDIDFSIIEELPESVLKGNVELFIAASVILLSKKKNIRDRGGFNVKIQMQSERKSQMPVLNTILVQSKKNILRSLPTLTVMPFSHHFMQVLFIPTPNRKPPTLKTINTGLAVYWNVFLFNNGVIGKEETERRLTNAGANIVYTDDGKYIDLSQSSLEGISLKEWYVYGADISDVTRFITYRVPLQISASIVSTAVYGFLETGYSNVMVLHPLTNGLMGGDNDNDKGTNHMVRYYLRISSNFSNLSDIEKRNIIRVVLGLNNKEAQDLLDYYNRNRYKSKSKDESKFIKVVEGKKEGQTEEYLDIHVLSGLIDKGDENAKKMMKFFAILSSVGEVSIRRKEAADNELEKKYSFSFDIVSYIPSTDKEITKVNIDNALVVSAYNYFTFPENTGLYPVSITGVKRVIYLLSDQKKSMLVSTSVDMSQNKTNIRNILRAIGGLVYLQTGFQLPEYQSALLYDAISTMISLTVDVVKDDTAQHGAQYFLLTELMRIADMLRTDNVGSLVKYFNPFLSVKDTDFFKDIVLKGNETKKEIFDGLVDQIMHLSKHVKDGMLDEDIVSLINSDIYFASTYSDAMLFPIFLDLYGAKDIIEVISAHKIKHNLGVFETDDKKLREELIEHILEKEKKIMSRNPDLFKKIKSMFIWSEISKGKLGKDRRDSELNGSILKSITYLKKESANEPLVNIELRFKRPLDEKRSQVVDIANLNETEEHIVYLNLIREAAEHYNTIGNEEEKRAFREYVEFVISAMSMIKTFRNMLSYKQRAFSMLKLSQFNAQRKTSDLMISEIFTLANPFTGVRHLLKSFNVNEEDTLNSIPELMKNFMLSTASSLAIENTFIENMLSSQLKHLEKYYKVIKKGDNVYIAFDGGLLPKMTLGYVRDRFVSVGGYIEILEDESGKKDTYLNITNLLKSKNKYLKENILKAIYYGMYVTEILNIKNKIEEQIKDSSFLENMSEEKRATISEELLRINDTLKSINYLLSQYVSKKDEKTGETYRIEDISLDEGGTNGKLSIMHFIADYITLDDVSVSVPDTHYRIVSGLYYKAYLLNKLAFTSMSAVDYRVMVSIANKSNFRANAAMYVLGLPPSSDNTMFALKEDSDGVRAGVDKLIEMAVGDKDMLFRDNVMQGLVNGFMSGLLVSSRVGYIGNNALTNTLIEKVLRATVKVLLSETSFDDDVRNSLNTRTVLGEDVVAIFPSSIRTMSNKLRNRKRNILQSLRYNGVNKGVKYIYSLPTLIDRSRSEAGRLRKNASNILLFIDKDLKSKHLPLLHALKEYTHPDIINLLGDIISGISLQHEITSWDVVNREARVNPEGISLGAVRYYHDINTTQSFINIVYQTKQFIENLKEEDIKALKDRLIESMSLLFTQRQYRDMVDGKSKVAIILYNAWYEMYRAVGGRESYTDAISIYVEELKSKIQESKELSDKEQQTFDLTLSTFKDVVSHNYRLVSLIEMVVDKKADELPKVSHAIFAFLQVLNILKRIEKQAYIKKDIVLDDAFISFGSTKIVIPKKVLEELFKYYKDKAGEVFIKEENIYSDKDSIYFIEGLGMLFDLLSEGGKVSELEYVFRVGLSLGLNHQKKANEIGNNIESVYLQLSHMGNKLEFSDADHVMLRDDMTDMQLIPLLYHMAASHHTRRIYDFMKSLKSEPKPISDVDMIDELLDEELSEEEQRRIQREEKERERQERIEKNNIMDIVISWDINKSLFGSSDFSIKENVQQDVFVLKVKEIFTEYLDKVIKDGVVDEKSMRLFDVYFKSRFTDFAIRYNIENVSLIDFIHKESIALMVVNGMFEAIASYPNISEQARMEIYKQVLSFILNAMNTNRAKANIINNAARIIRDQVRKLQQDDVITLNIDSRKDLYDLLLIFAANAINNGLFMNTSITEAISGKSQPDAIMVNENQRAYRIYIRPNDELIRDSIASSILKTLHDNGLAIADEQKLKAIESYLATLKENKEKTKC